MQQQVGHPMGAVAPASPANITTEQIQKYLDENKQLILAILENQNLGKLPECAQYQALLQKNLLYLAAIADAQPPNPTARPQMIPHAAMQQGGGSHFVQQPPVFPPRPSLQFSPQQMQEHQQQQQQLHHQPQLLPFQGHIGMRPVAMVNGMHAQMHTEPSHGGGSTTEVPPGGQNLAEFPRGSTATSSVDGRAGKQDAGGATPEPAASAAAAADGQRSTAKGHGTGDKRPEDTKTP